RHRFIFLHCRKVAGSAIKRALFPTLGPDDVMIGSWHECLRHGGRLNRAARRALAHPRAWPGVLRGLLRGDWPAAVNQGVKHFYMGALSDTPAHPTAEEIARAFPEEWASFFKFCFVRNPYSQLLSDYFWRKKVSGEDTSFRQFLQLRAEGRVGPM